LHSTSTSFLLGASLPLAEWGRPVLFFRFLSPPPSQFVMSRQNDPLIVFDPPDAVFFFRGPLLPSYEGCQPFSGAKRFSFRASFIPPPSFFQGRDLRWPTCRPPSSWRQAGRLFRTFFLFHPCFLLVGSTGLCQPSPRRRIPLGGSARLFKMFRFLGVFFFFKNSTSLPPLLGC